jgi:hypothetical protein
MMAPIRWLFVVMVSVGALLGAGGWQPGFGQAGGPGNWEFFASPTRNPVEPRWGSYRDVMRQDREAAAAKNNYCPTSGCVVRLDRLTMTPKRVERGRQATIGLSYTILTADDIGIPVTITREILFKGKPVGKTSSKNMRTPNGSFDQDVNFIMPKDSAPGTYTLKTRISTGYGQDEKSVDFTVD